MPYVNGNIVNKEKPPSDPEQAEKAGQLKAFKKMRPGL